MSPEEHVQEESYVIPSRTITGSAQQVLDEIDDMMQALRTVREVVVRRAPKPARVAERGWRARVRRLLRFPLPPFRDRRDHASAKR
jgi:hypothetical protein